MSTIRTRKCFSQTCDHLVPVNKHGGGPWVCSSCLEAVKRLIGDEKKRDEPKTTLKCPLCNSSMVRKSGPGGVFYGCSKYPKCRGSKNV